MEKYICIHGHFYQPPRENPWLESIELQDTAYPYHDWNERITNECYERNSASRILSDDKYIINIQNNYSNISFNFGPTLLSWIEFHEPDLYKAILQADKDSMKKFNGHGAALAQAYNHMILPLANRRDKETQVIWGIKDFEKRFQRKPEGIWLPETAVDTESLEVLAENGIQFTILAPRQAKAYRKIGDKKWNELKGENIDPKRPYLCNLPSGKNIVLFFYDGPVSKDIAFQNLLRDGKAFAERLMNVFDKNKDGNQLVHVATDGETYGHHHRFGEMALSYCLHHIQENNLANITIYGDYLEKFPPKHEAKVHDNSSWSCAHGVERWRSDCGCHSGMNPGWSQQWRGPLRESLDFLRDETSKLYEKEVSKNFADPWKLRNDYVDVILNRTDEHTSKLIEKHAISPKEEIDRVKTLKLLELQRNALLMYTSCGWFFDELSGIETVQVIQYAARVIQLAKEMFGNGLEDQFLSILKKAKSNLPHLDNGEDVYNQHVRPAIVDLWRVGAHFAISSLFHDYGSSTRINSFQANLEYHDQAEIGRQKLANGKIEIQSVITGEKNQLVYAVVHFGDHNLMGGVKEGTMDDGMVDMFEELKLAFHRNNVPKIIHLMEENFQQKNFSFWYLFKDEQRFVLNRIIRDKIKATENQFRELFYNNYSIIRVLKEMNTPVPQALRVPGEIFLNTELKKLFNTRKMSPKKLEKIANELNTFSFELDQDYLGFEIANYINYQMGILLKGPHEEKQIKRLVSTLKIIHGLPINLDLWRAQNMYFKLGKSVYPSMQSKAEAGDEKAQDWMNLFGTLGDYLKVKYG